MSFPNGLHLNSGGGIYVNSGGTLVTDSNTSVADGGTVTVSGGGVLSAMGISAAVNATISLSGGTLAATDGIVLRTGISDAYGEVAAGTSLVVGGATQHGKKPARPHSPTSSSRRAASTVLQTEPHGQV